MSFCAVMILNWNGARWLERCLPSIVTAAEVVGAEVWVIDNESHDESELICRRDFPTVRFEAMGVNKVLASYNLAMSRCQSEVIVLLNNDIVVEKDFLPPLLATLQDPTVFSVSPCIRGLTSGDNAETEADLPIWDHGMVRRAGCRLQEATSIFFTCGGAMACRRDRFVELGGFDELYLPGYQEDIDLSWRAWKRGWTCRYEPASVVYHAGGASMGRSERVTTLMLRNEFLFHWKNLSSPSLIAVHVSTTLPRLLVALARGDRARRRGFFQALMKLPQVWQSRRRAAPQFLRGDVEVLRLFATSAQACVGVPEES